MSGSQVGIDIVEIEDLRQKINSSKSFLDKILHEAEINKSSIESIAGKIAAKEAIIKTGYISVGEWKRIVVTKDNSGKPKILDQNGKQIKSIKVTISHTDKIAVAFAIYEKI